MQFRLPSATTPDLELVFRTHVTGFPRLDPGSSKFLREGQWLLRPFDLLMTVSRGRTEAASY